MSRRNPRTAVLPAPLPRDEEFDPESDAIFAQWLGERLRRVALGSTVALVTARAFWPSEPDLRADAGGGMGWVLVLFIAMGLGIAGALIGGALRLRLSWADLGVMATLGLVALSSLHAIDRRPALNLAWEWVAFAFVYFLFRNFPRTRAESTAIAGALVATAVAVAVYGLYQVVIELPQVRLDYLAHKDDALRMLGIAKDSPQQAAYENRLLGSNEPYSTFALANSLAGFIVGPLVLMIGIAWQNLTRAGGKGSRLTAVGLAAIPALLLLVCLVLTKSRSAWIGLTIGVLVLAWRERKRVPKRMLVFAGAGAIGLVVILAGLGLATGRLDRQVLTQSGLSMKYRQQYWIGTWRAINASSRSFWEGYGPGNLTPPYVLHKLPEASEEVADPHDFVLEVWATAGLPALIALAAALAFLLRDLLGGGKFPADPDQPKLSTKDDPSAPPKTSGWLIAASAVGLILVVVFRLEDFFQKEMLERWLVLAVGWWLAVGFGSWVFRRMPVDGAIFGAAVLAVLVNLIAAGGSVFRSWPSGSGRWPRSG